MNDKDTTTVELRKGISLSRGIEPPPGKDGLDFWLSAAAKPWIEGTLKATGLTVSIERGTAKAALIVYLRRLVPGLTLASGYPYSTILGDVALFWEQFARLRRVLRQKGVSRMELALSPVEMQRCLTADSDRWIAAHYLDSLQATRQIMDLGAFSSLDQLQSCYPSKLRWAIRKANKSGARVAPAEPDCIARLQQLYKDTMREKGAPAYYGAQRLHILAGDLAPAGRGAIFAGFINGEPAGMAAAIDSEITRHLIQVAVPRAYRNYRLSDLLVSNAIQDAFQKGKRYFDFMSTARGDAGLVQFKEKWGAASENTVHAVVALKPFASRLIDSLRRASRVLAGLRRMRN